MSASLTITALVLVTGMQATNPGNFMKPKAEFVHLNQTIDFETIPKCIEAKEAIKYTQWHNVVAIKVSECKENVE